VPLLLDHDDVDTLEVLYDAEIFAVADRFAPVCTATARAGHWSGQSMGRVGPDAFLAQWVGSCRF